MRNAVTAWIVGVSLSLLTSPGYAAPASTKTWEITGRVEVADGKPVSGAKVWLPGFDSQVEKSASFAVSDADGKFRFETKMRPRGLVVEATSSDGNLFAYGQLPWDLSPEDAVSLVKLTLRTPRKLPVQVRNGQQQPVADARVIAVANYRKVAEAVTDADGRAELRLAADAPLSAVVALKPGLGVDYHLVRGASEPVSDPYRLAPDHSGHIDFALTGIRPVTLHLLDDEGQPLAGQVTRPWLINRPNKGDDLNLSGLREFDVKTDRDGLAKFELIPADNARGVTFWVSAPGFSQQRVEFNPAKDPSDLEARLKRLVPASGTVTHADGRPAAGIEVQVSGSGYAFDGFRGTATSDAAGRFSLDVDPDQYYQFAAGNREWASAAVNRIVLAGVPVDGIELHVTPAKRVFGQITIGSNKQPATGSYTQLHQEPSVDYYDLPEAQQLPNPTDSNTAISPRIVWSGATDAEGRFEYFVGPGSYYLIGPSGTTPPHFELKDQASYEANLHTERPDTVPISGRVVMRDHPELGVAGVRIEGVPKNFVMRELRAISGADGRFEGERGSAEMVIYARTPDRKLAGITTIGPDDSEVTIQLAPTSSARARLVDEDGKTPLVGRQVDYGVLITSDDQEFQTFSWRFGSSTTTDQNGELLIDDLVVGQEYVLKAVQETSADGSPRSWTSAGKVTPTSTAVAEMGDVIVKWPYKEPTITERVAQRFKDNRSLDERLSARARDAGFGYQNVLLVVGDPASPLVEQLYEQDFGGSISAPTMNYLFLPLSTVAPDRLQDLDAQLASRDIPLPAADDVTLVAFDKTGKQLGIARGEELFASGLLDDAKLVNFLNAHAPKLPDAEELYADALAQAKREDKRLFVQCSGPRCGWCTVLSRYIDDHAELFQKEFVYLKLDPRLGHGDDVIKRIRTTQEGGIPWFVFLDPDGKPLITSDGPDGNIGHPGEVESRIHFEKMLRTDPRHLTDAEIESLIAALAGKEQ